MSSTKKTTLWPLYAIIETAQALQLVGITVNPTKADPSRRTINLAAARRALKRAFIPKTLTITDQATMQRVLAAASTPAGFVQHMNEIATERKQGKQAIKAINALRELL